MKKQFDYNESPTMREVHQIQEELEQQYQKSGLSYLEWLEATEADFQKSLIEDGFHIVTRNGETFIEEIKPPAPINKNKQPTVKTAKHKNYDDYIEDSTMREIHRIQEKMEQQYEKSGLASYWEWLQATEADMHKSLAEVGFAIVTRDGRTFVDEIKPKRTVNKARTLGTGKTNRFKLPSLSSRTETAKPQNYDDMIEASRAQELQLVREDRASSGKIEPQPQKQPVKYKHKAVSNSGSSASRKKRAK
jgi:hypothetical protein